jgi:hypothetical protein
MSLTLVETESTSTEVALYPTDVASHVQANPTKFLQDEKLREHCYAALEHALKTFEPDLSTDKSRKAIATFARKFITIKTSVDAAGKELTEEARASIDAVNKLRKEAKEKLDDMAARAREPLTQWEIEEAERKRQHAETLTFLRDVVIIYESTTAQEVLERIERLQEVPETPAFVDAKAAALETLTAAHDRILKQEAERAELEALRAEKAKREAEEEARKREEAKRLADEQRTKEAEERRQREAAAAEERRLREAEEEEARRQHAAKALEERIEQERKAAAAKAIEDERRRVEDAERDRIAAEQKAAAEEEKRAQNKRHRAQVEKRAIGSLLSAVPILDQVAAKAVIDAIARGEVEFTSIQY